MKNLLVSCLLTAGGDPQMQSRRPKDRIPFGPDHPGVVKWEKSLEVIKVPDFEAVVLHDLYEDVAGSKATWIRQKRMSWISPYDRRWQLVWGYLFEQLVNGKLDSSDRVFITDISDVVVLEDPFAACADPAFDGVHIFTGDEPCEMGKSPWMRERQHRHHRLQGLDRMFDSRLPLLNCGIIGGRVRYVDLVLSRMLLGQVLTAADRHLGDTEMVIYNWALRGLQEEGLKIFHGLPLNTRFKSFATGGAWFAHK